MDPSINHDKEDLSSQLHETLHESVAHGLSTQRPLLTHLNADTTWLLSIPYPASSPSPRNRIYYHILIDPWLQGPQSDVAAFFSRQWHAVPSAVQTIAELEEVIAAIESAAQGRGAGRRTKVKSGDTIVVDPDIEQGAVEACIKGDGKELDEQNTSHIDAVVISHEFTDHMHQDTLLEISATVPVFATTKAASIIKSWKHFDSVAEVPRFQGDWRKSSSEKLPKWIGVSRVAYAGKDLLYYHSAIMVCFAGEGRSPAEAVIYTPHGISPSNLAPVATASPEIQTLALLHGLQDISLTRAQLNLGAHNGLKVQRLLGAKYWIGTHDEVKKGGGIVSWFLNRKIITLQEAIEREKKEVGEAERKAANLDEVRFEAVPNGKSLVLE
jgi:hypothetical protein